MLYKQKSPDLYSRLNETTVLNITKILQILITRKFQLCTTMLKQCFSSLVIQSIVQWRIQMKDIGKRISGFSPESFPSSELSFITQFHQGDVKGCSNKTLLKVTINFDHFTGNCCLTMKFRLAYLYSKNWLCIFLYSPFE